MKKLFEFGGQLSSKQNALWTVIGALFLLCVWYLVTISGMISNKILPNPVDVISTIPTIVSDYHLFDNMWYTIRLNIAGFVYAILLALPTGMFIATIPVLNSMFTKILSALRFIPLPAASGIFIAAFGLSFFMKSMFLCAAVFFSLLPAVIQIVSELQNPANVKDNVYLQTAHTLGLSSLQKLRYIYIPFVLGNIYIEIVNLVSISYTFIVIAECFDKTGGGLGALISTLQRQSNMAGIYCILFIIIIIGILQDLILRRLEPVFFPYKKH